MATAICPQCQKVFVPVGKGRPGRCMECLRRDPAWADQPATEAQLRFLLQQAFTAQLEDAEWTRDDLRQVTKGQAFDLIKALKERTTIPLPGTIVTSPTSGAPSTSTIDPTPEPTTPEPTNNPTPEPTTPEPTTPSSLDTLIADIARKAAQEALANMPATLDVERVQEIVGEAVRNLAPTHVHVPSMPEPVVIDEPTHEAFGEVLWALSAGMHVWLTGPAGTGKSHMVMQAAKALGLGFEAQSVDQSITSSKLRGAMDAHGIYHATPYRRAWNTEGRGSLILFDEFDNGHPSVNSCLNQDLAQGEKGLASFPDGMIPMGEGFRCAVTCNTWGTGPTAEYVGRAAQDFALANRFWKVFVGIDEKLEEALAGRWLQGGQLVDWLATVRRHRANAETHKIKVLITPRDTIRGAMALAAGKTTKEASNYLRTLSADQLAKVTRER